MFITTPIRVLRLLPFSPSSFSAATSSRPALLVRTLITSSFYRPPLAKSPTLRPDWGSELAYRGFAYGNCGFFAARCASSVSSPGILEWNEPVSCSEVGSGQNDNDVEDAKSSVPVRAYLFSTSVDLKSLVEQNKANYIPPSSRMTNYAVFKFGTLSTDPNVSLLWFGGFPIRIIHIHAALLIYHLSGCMHCIWRSLKICLALLIFLQRNGW
uniref:Uncharacterized protein n=1 Tax=Kalanchoe fedtschenkoi TaxID=63787 RepID=A0A7N0V853_KALFE